MINKKKIDEIRKQAKTSTIVAATKYVDVDDIKELYNEGITNIGENRTDSFLRKHELLKDLDIKWHFIGTLQSRKVESMINKIDYLHSLDSVKLASVINKYRLTPLKCFIEVNVSKEESKHGIYVENIANFMNEIKKYDKIEVIGLMTMAPNTDDIELINRCFHELKEAGLQNNLYEFSMGMSNDYLIAIKNGSTFIRLGRILFEGEME